MRRLVAVTAAILAFGAFWASGALAAFGLDEAELGPVNQDGTPATEAGSHPFALDTFLAFNTVFDDAIDTEIPEGSSKGLRISLPQGLAGNPTAMPICPQAVFVAELCPATTEIGLADVFAGDQSKPVPVPVYNLGPGSGMAAKIGFKALTVPLTVSIRINPDPPYNLVASVENIPQVIPFYASKLRIWGTPAAAAHDAERLRCGASCSLDLDEKPFLLLPRSCTPTLDSVFEVSSWEDPSDWIEKPASAPGLLDCSSLEFAPDVSAQPTAGSTTTSSGIDLEVNVTDTGINDPKGVAQSDIQKAVVTLPEGVTANAAVAEGLVPCTEVNLKAETLTAQPGQGCPQASKIGTLEAQTPLLEGRTLTGSVFAAEPYKNRFGTLVALYATLREPDLGILIKLEGKVEPDPRTGQLVGTFEGLPQYPVSHFALHFRSGRRSPLVTPPRCGQYETKAVLTPWADPSASYTTTSTFTVSSGPGGGPCPAGTPPLDPGFEAGTSSNAASRYSPYFMRVTRRDGEQEITRLDTVLPKGVAGKIAGISACSDAAIAAAKTKSGLAERAQPSCPDASWIGRVLVGSGVGPDLTYVPGNVFLAGPFGGHALSVAVITPAVAGPFDVGTVVIREALSVDPVTAEVQIDGAASEPIPRILAGVPLNVRDIRVYVDRPNFTFNATSCEPLSAKATIFGSALNLLSTADDVGMPESARYQASDCGDLGFKPKISLQLKGGTKRGQHAALRSLVTYPYKSGPGYSNIGRAAVVLPPSQQIDNAHINNPCTRAQFAANACPKTSILGTARAFTPLLDKPLEGTVYFRSNGGVRLLPDVVVDLHGQFDVELVGAVDTLTPNTNPRIRTTFAQVPDAPVTKFALNLFGGKRGLLINNSNVCRTSQKAEIRLTAHSGKRHNFSPRAQTSCGGKDKSTRR